MSVVLLVKANKDTLERRFLDSFRAAYAFFPVGRIRKGVPGIEPDFIVENENEKIGIEMARLYRDDGKDGLGVKPQARLQERVVEEAKQLFEKSSKKMFRVFITFNERSGIEGKQVQHLASYLSELVRKELENRLPTSGHPIMIGPSYLYPHAAVFSLIQIYDFTNDADCSWTRNNVNEVELLNEDVLLDVIERKERKYESGHYSGCDRVWLLLYMHYFDPAMDQCTPIKLGFTIETSNFDRILLYKTIENEMRQLYPSE